MKKRYAVSSVIFGICLILAPLPAVSRGFTNYALFFSMYAGTFFLFLPEIAWLVRKLSGRLYPKIRIVFLVLLSASFLYVFTLLGFMISSAVPKEVPEETKVLILGCGIVGSRPDAMMQARLDAAALYMEEHPEAKCICSGGITGNGISEAFIMKEYLLKKGISETRIELEAASSSTRENIVFSKELILKDQTGNKVLIATDPYHQFRAAFYARKEGLDAYPLNSKTPSYLVPAFWIRELFGITRGFILGY